MKYILVSRSCNECGGNVLVRQFDFMPTDDEKKALKRELGGMCCIETKIFCTEDGYEYTELED